MTIQSVADIIKKSISKYPKEDIVKDLDELKQNGGINKIKDFDKLMTYFIKSKSFMKNIYNIDLSLQYAEIFEKILDMHPENGIYTDEQMLYLCEKTSISKKLIETSVNRGYNMKYEHLVAYLSGIIDMSINFTMYNYEDVKENISYIIKVFVNRKNISSDEYVDITKYNKIESFILFRPYYFKQILNVEMDENDKNFMKDFIVKFKYFDEFYNHLIRYEQRDIVLPFTNNHNWVVRNEFLNKYKNSTQLHLYRKLVGLDLYDIILSPVFETEFNNKYSNLSDELNTYFICNLYNYYSVNVPEKDLFEYYDKKFNNIIKRLKKINNKITLNNYLIDSKNYNKICEIYTLQKLDIEKINKTQQNISSKTFEEIYSGDYNTILLNKCIKLDFDLELIEFLLKIKKINFDNETLRYAIYTKNLNIIRYMLDNKYIGSDKDLLYCVEGGFFLRDLISLYKEYNILISDEVYKEFKMRKYMINYESCINGDDTKHMEKLDQEVETERTKIFPFDTYHNNTDYSFYYDMAKRGELTLDIISNIHHIVGADGIKHLVRLYMEFNQNKILQMDEKPKKIIKKVVKKVINSI